MHRVSKSYLMTRTIIIVIVVVQFFVTAYCLNIIIIIIIIESIYSLWSIGNPWRASKRCDLQLSPWPDSMIFLYFLFHPLLSFATFSLAYLFFHTPEDSNLMQFSLLLLLLYVICVQSNSFSSFYLNLYWLLLGDSPFFVCNLSGPFYIHYSS